VSADLLTSTLRAVEMATEAGADNVWAGVTQNRDVEFNYRDGTLHKVKDTTARTLAISIYVSGRYATYDTSDLDPDRLRDFLREAVGLTETLEPDEFRTLTPAELFGNRSDLDLQLQDENIVRLGREQRLQWCASLDDAVRQYEGVISATSGVYDGSAITAAASSNGFSGSYRSSYCWLGTEVALQDRDERRADDWFYAGARQLGDLPDTSFIAAEAIRRAIARLGADKGLAQQTTMLVDARAAAGLVDRLLQPASAARVQQGRSFWAALPGNVAFSDKLSIIDDPLIPRAFGSRPFDEEGISAQAFPLIEAGVVRNLYVDTYFGRKTGLSPTTGTPSNRRVVPGDLSRVQMLADAGVGIYVTSWLDGNVDEKSGDFSFALRGHQIENGAIGRPVRDMNISGNLRELFSRLEATGNDVYPYATTLSPSLMFSGVSFSSA
jgi:PmbA protein